MKYVLLIVSAQLQYAHKWVVFHMFVSFHLSKDPWNTKRHVYTLDIQSYFPGVRCFWGVFRYAFWGPPVIAIPSRKRCSLISRDIWTTLEPNNKPPLKNRPSQKWNIFMFQPIDVPFPRVGVFLFTSRIQSPHLSILYRKSPGIRHGFRTRSSAVEGSVDRSWWHLWDLLVSKVCCVVC